VNWSQPVGRARRRAALLSGEATRTRRLPSRTSISPTAGREDLQTSGVARFGHVRARSRHRGKEARIFETRPKLARNARGRRRPRQVHRRRGRLHDAGVRAHRGFGDALRGRRRAQHEDPGAHGRSDRGSADRGRRRALRAAARRIFGEARRRLGRRRSRRRRARATLGGAVCCERSRRGGPAQEEPDRHPTAGPEHGVHRRRRGAPRLRRRRGISCHALWPPAAGAGAAPRRFQGRVEAFEVLGPRIAAAARLRLLRPSAVRRPHKSLSGPDP
ncbi:hypothetical protein M885DRAFT_610105, partial [Pelagophyceae sp. CCMP2097]